MCVMAVCIARARLVPFAPGARCDDCATCTRAWRVTLWTEEEDMRVLDTLPLSSGAAISATFPAGSWGCEAGMLRTVAEAEPMDLITRQQYRHFELTSSGAPPAAASGISRVTEALPHAWQRGLAMQLLDNAHHPDGQTPETAAGALYGLIAPRRTVPSRSAASLRPASWSVPATWNSGSMRLVVVPWQSPAVVRWWLTAGFRRCLALARRPAVTWRSSITVPRCGSVTSLCVLSRSADGRSAGPGAGVTRAGTRRRRGQAMRGVVGATSEDAMKTARHGCRATVRSTALPALSCSMPRCTPPSASRRPFSPPWSTRAGCPPRSWDSC